MRLRRFGTFAGGIDLPDDKHATLDAPIAPISRLERLKVPLAPVAAEPARLRVRIGQRVKQGQRLAEGAGPGQVNVFAPAGGAVARLTEVTVPEHPAGWRACPAVELVELEAAPGVQEAAAQYEWQAADEHSIRLRIAEGGLTTYRRPVVALSGWLEAARLATVNVLIANVTENSPFITADHRLLAEHGSEVIRGLTILARAIGARNVTLAVDHRCTDDYRSAVGPAKLHGVEAIALTHKYPIGADAVLVKVLTRREIPPGGTALDVAAAVTDAATCWATYRWVACGQPPTARVVTVSGPAAGVPGNLLIPFGAEISEVLRLAEVPAEEPAVDGSPMWGRLAAESAVVTAQTDGLLALKTRPAPPPTPCIRCGWCVENCPAMLNVAALNDDFELGRLDRARGRQVLACMDCGICSYVCPGRLPLAHRLSLLKQAVRQMQGVTPDAAV